MTKTTDTKTQNKAKREDKRKMIEKITALLAKAESTTHVAEAEAFSAKAQELMARYAIDEALLASTKSRQSFKVVAIKVKTPAPYGTMKATLLHCIADTNGCRAIQIDISPRDPHCMLVGTETDVKLVELLFTSLLVQQGSAMLTREKELAEEVAKLDPAVVKHDAEFSPTSAAYALRWPRVFRPNFMLGFTAEVAERLIHAKNATVKTYSKTDQKSAALVLVKRTDAVDAEFKKLFPTAEIVKSSQTQNRAAQAAGRKAGAKADVGNTKVAGNKGAIAS